MNSTSQTSKLNVVWATVILTVLIGWGLTIVAFTSNHNLGPVAVSLLIGVIPAFLTIPLLLASGDDHATKTMVGRGLVWAQALALLVACILGIVITM